MTSRDCFYCGKRVAAGKSCSVLFLDGRGCPPSDSEIIQYAQLCDTSDATIKHDAGHAALRRGISEIACSSFACYRLLKDVNNYVAINVRGTRSVGEASSSTTILPAHRKEVLTARREEAAAFYPLGPRGGISKREVTLIASFKIARSSPPNCTRLAQRRSNHLVRSSHLVHHRVHGLRHRYTAYD